MRAVKLSPTGDAAIVSTVAPHAATGETLVRPTVVGICGTDLHAAALPELFRPDTVLGHEMVGVVVSSTAPGLVPETHVVVNPNGEACGTCRECGAGRTNICFVATRERCVGVQRNGGLADLVAVASASLHVVNGISDEKAVWTEPLAAAVRAVKTCLAFDPDSVAVLGGGPVGLLAAQLLTSEQVAQLTVFEPRVDRVEIGRALGLRMSDPTAIERGASSFDVVLDCAGVAASVSAAVDLVRPAGRIVLLGVPPDEVALDIGRVVLNEIELRGSMIYTDEEFRAALELLRTGTIETASLVSAVVSLPEFVDLYPRIRSGRDTGQKVLVRVSN